MEAVPRLPMITFDLKASHENASFGLKLKQYIADFYREDPESYNNEIHQLEGLRSAAVRPALDLTGCAALKRYFCQLKSLQSRFPMNKGQPAAVTFAWKDLFANIVCTLADIRFEIVCVLYNIGALHCKLGAAESRATPESMKAACTHFQSAVWAFQHLREHYPQPSGIDLSPEVMKLFQDVCLAQAQECILEKSMQDNRKPSIVGAIGMQVLNYYKGALSALESSQSADNFQENVGSKMCNTWIKYLTFKVSYISCVVYLFQGMHSEEQQKMGERVAFYQAACDKLVEAKKLSKGLPQMECINEALTFTNDVVEGKRKAAKNENEFIYHEEVPDKDLLSEPKPASLAKGIPVNLNDPEVSGPDIFGRLVPMGAHEASSMYSEEKAKLLRKIIGAVDIKDSQLNDFMSSLHLDQLDAFNQPERLPQDLVDRCASLSVKTDAIQNLIDTMNSLADIHTEVEAMLHDTRKIIQEEESNEKEYQQIMGSARPPSIVSTELSREANKYLDAHNKANESNQTLHKAMTLHLANLKILILPLEEIDVHVPSLNSIKDSVDNASIAEMRTLVAKVNEMQTQRNMLVAMLRESVNADDITSQLVTRTGESLDEIFKQEIEKHNKQVGLIEQNMVAQENILKALTDAYAKYATTRKLISDVLRKRDSTLTALIASYDTYEDLLNKSLKGLEFYRKLLSNVSRLLTRVKSTCKVQEEERSQLLANNLSKQAVAAAKSSSAEVNTSISALPKDSASSGPKLKDFLPYMKNRSSAGYQPAVDTNPSDSAYAGQMYPPYIRPAPVGSEGTSDSQSTNYPDTSRSTRQAYQSDADGYKGYQYIQQATGQYTAHSYPEQTAYSYGNYDSSYSKPEAGMHYYQQFNALTVADNVSNTLKSANSSDAKQNIAQSNSVQYQQPSLPPYSQYNPTAAITTYPAVTGGGAYDTYSYAGIDKNTTNVNNQAYAAQSVSMSNQYANQNYPGYNPLDSNPLPASYGSDLSGQMQNMNISYPQQNVNPDGSYSVMPNQQQINASSNQQQTSSIQNVPYSGAVYADPNNPTLSQYDANNSLQNSGNNYYSSNNPSPATSSNMAYSSPATQPYVNTFDGGVLTNTGNQYQNINQELGAQSYQSSQFTNNSYPSPQPLHQAQNAPLSQNYQSVPSENLGSSQPYTYPNSENAGYPSAATLQSSNNAQFTPMTIPDVKQETSDAPIQSHIQQHYPSPAIQAQEVQPSLIYNSQYNTSNYYNNEVPQLETKNTDVNSASVAQNYIPQQYSGGNQAQTPGNQPQAGDTYPGYTYNPSTGTYYYNYEYPKVENNPSVEMQYANYSNVSQMNNLYTNAGTYGTTQTQSVPFDQSAVDASVATSQSGQNSQYYSLPYGHQSVGYSTPSTPSDPQNNQTEVVAANNENPKSYSKQTSLTYVNSNDNKTTTTNSDQGNGAIKSSPSKEEPTEETKKAEPPVVVKEPSAIDLLSGLDFTVEQKPLMPEIKVPPISEHVIRKAPSLDDTGYLSYKATEEVNSQMYVKIADRPPKRDLFSDPSLLNKFTQEVKSLQLFVDGFTKKTHSGITMLDSKWKKMQDAQAKENCNKSTKVAKDNLGKNASPDVFPYDDSRVVLKVDSDEGYVNASHVQQISSWAIPMIVSDLPIEENYIYFWQMVYQQKVSIIVCLQTEIELQGKFYGPTAKNQKLELSPDLNVTLTDINNCNVNWTERKLVIQYKNIQHIITHYQINVFPARIVSAPLVLLVDKILNTRDENVDVPEDEEAELARTLVHCSTGAGRSALIVLLTMVMCQVRAGYVELREMLDTGFLYLCGTRTNVLEDTKYLVDIYRTVLFYVQGVLCSGTVAFSGEAVSVPSGASIPPPFLPTHSRQHSTESLSKFSKESFEEMKQAAGLKSGDMKDPLSYLDPLWSLKKRKE